MYYREDIASATEVSPLIQRAVFSLRDSTDFNITTLLLRAGPLPFSELKRRLELRPITLDRRLKRLMDGALLNQYYAKKEGTKAYSFYDVTLLGQELFTSLVKLGRPASALPKKEKAFYQPGPEILDVFEEMSRMIEQVKRSFELPRSIEE